MFKIVVAEVGARKLCRVSAGFFILLFGCSVFTEGEGWEQEMMQDLKGEPK